MEEVEPVEQAQEEIHEHAHHAKEPWIGWVALTAALLAALAAVGSSLSGHHESEGVLERVEASDQWQYFQAKGVKQQGIQTKMEILSALGKEPSEKDKKKLEQYDEDKAEIKTLAAEKEAASRNHMRLHSIFSRSVTFSQIAIAVAAISVLTKRRKFWVVSMGFGAVGLYFLCNGFFW